VNPTPAGSRSSVLRLLALLVLVAFAFQGTRGIWEPDEGRYTSAGLNMHESGDWLIPTIDGEHPHLTKPPVVYWALASSFALLGHNEWAARLPGALAFIGTGLLVFGLGQRFCPAKPWLPALAYGVSLAPILGASVVSTDVLLTFFEALAMYCFVRAYDGPGEMARPWLRAMWVAWGLAFMTKGPPGLLPLLAMVVMLAIHDRRALPRLFDPLGLVAFAVVAFTWFGILIAQDPSRFRYFVGYEVYDRVFTSAHDRNAYWYAPITIFGPMFFVGALPWWVLALAAAGGPRPAWTAFRTKLRSGNRNWRLLAWWFLLPFAVFCLAQSRLQLYVLPLFVPLSLMIARPLSDWPWLTARRLTVVAVSAAAALIALKAFAGHVHTDRDSRSMARAITKIVDPQRFDEIVFVGMRPFYGLNLYLDIEVEGVQIAEHRYDYSKFVAEENLCAELDERERSVFALKESKAGTFQVAVERCEGLDPSVLGRFDADGNRIVLFVVRR
jgi:4-amino-4-deoxy-L-arabinose transferase